MACAAIDKEICLFGGRAGDIRLNTIQEFVIFFPLTFGNIFVQQDYGKNTFTIVKPPTKVTIGVKYVYKGNSNNVAEFVDAYLFDGTNWVNINTGDTAPGSGYTVNFSNDLGENPSTSGKVEYTLDGTTWNTVLEWSNGDGDKQPLQVTSLSNVSTIKFRLTMSDGEPSTLTLTGTVVGSTTKVFEIETNFSTTTVSTDMLTLTSAINVSITNGDTAP